MSYDIYLRASKCEHCGQYGPGEDHWNPTYNLTPIFDHALTGEELPNSDISEMEVVLFRKETDRPRGMRLLDGKKAGDTIAWLEKALGHVMNPANAAKFRELEPPNKWGTLEDAQKVFGWLLEAAKEYPGNVWEVH